MADYFTTPKTDWTTPDGIGYEDLNRIEQNLVSVIGGVKRRVQGFGFFAHNDDASYDGLITVTPGSCFSDNGVPIIMTANHSKNLNAWAQGNGNGFGGMASAVTVAQYTWYYIFVILNPETGATDIQFDDNTAGTNISSLTFTEKRLIGAFETNSAGTHSSFNTLEMWSDGDNTYINPWDFPSSTQKIVAHTSNVYSEQVIEDSTRGPLLPLVQVEAFMTIYTEGFDFGLYNSMGYFTAPVSFVSGSNYRGEYVYRIDHNVNTSSWTSEDVRFPVSATNRVRIATNQAVAGGAGIEIWVRGFYWDRLQ